MVPHTRRVAEFRERPMGVEALGSGQWPLCATALDTEGKATLRNTGVTWGLFTNSTYVKVVIS